MRRPPRLWFRSRDNRWYVTIEGKKTNLFVPGPDNDETRARADAALRELLAAHQALICGNVATRPTPAPTVSAAAADYLAHCGLRHKAGRLSEGSLANYRNALAPFVAAFGPRPVSDFAPADGRLEAEAWAASVGWSGSYQHTVLGVIQAALKRAGVAVRFDRPPMESRGPDVCLSDEQFSKVLQSLYLRPTRGDLGELLVLLRASGRRPGEVSNLRVEEMDWENCCRLQREHKTKRKTGRDALWVFNSAAMLVLKTQRERYGSGLLFRNDEGRAYTRRCMSNALGRVSRRVGFRVIAYAGRHSFATRALENGVPEAMVAALLGHTSTAMVAKHYGHLGSKADAMRAAAERVSGSGRAAG